MALNGSDWGAMRVLMDVEDSKEASVNEWLENYTNEVNSNMTYDSKESVEEEYASFGSMIKIVGVVVAGILGLIGLMNFANTMITSIIVRSRELAMLEAVGMTGKQQKQISPAQFYTYKNVDSRVTYVCLELHTCSTWCVHSIYLCDGSCYTSNRLQQDL